MSLDHQPNRPILGSILSKSKVNPHSFVPVNSCYDPHPWSFGAPVDRLHYQDSYNTYNYYPGFFAYQLFRDEHYSHDDAWSRYTSSEFDKRLFDWREVLEDYPITLKHFFIKNQIDTPTFLRQKRSKFRPQFSHPADRLVGMLSRHGKLNRMRLYYLWVYNQLAREVGYNDPSLNTYDGSKLMVNLALMIPAKTSNDVGYVPGKPESQWSPVNNDLSVLPKSRFGHVIHEGFIDFNVYLFFYNLLSNKLRQYFPIFAMKPRRVDKLRYKHSRGKSGKYVVEWRYIPQYKRLDVVLRWLVDDVILQKAPKFKLQILKSIHLLLTSSSEHTVHKNRSYVHLHVFSRYKQTLVRTLKKI